MKTTRKIFALVLVLLFVVSLAACGEKKTESKDDNSGNAAASSSASAAAPATEAPAVDNTGTYSVFGMKNTAELGDIIVSTTGLLDMSITLNADGTANMASNGEESTGTWTAAGEQLTMTSSEGETLNGTIKNGIIELNDGEGITAYLAKPGADTSAYDVKSAEEVMGALAQ